MGMKPEDLRVIHALDQAETRIIDLVRHHPHLGDDATVALLDELGVRWQITGSPFYEFMYHVAWIGCHRVRILDDERDQIDLDLRGRNTHDDDNDDIPEPVGT